MKTSSKKWQKIRKIKGLRQFVTWYPRHVSENPGLKGKTFLYYMDKEGKYIQYVIDGDKALRGREIDEYHKIYTYEDVIDLVDVILIMNTRHYNSIQEKVNTEIKIIDMDQYIDSENEVKNII